MLFSFVLPRLVFFFISLCTANNLVVGLASPGGDGGISPPSSTQSSSSSSSSSLRDVHFRAGTVADTVPIAWQLSRELMNPFGIRADRFIVAGSSSSSSSSRLGWAQIRPMASNDRRNAMIEKETDDIVWDNFEENEAIRVPVGWQSLPWTTEYREFARAATAQRERQRQSRETIRRQVELETPSLYELSSVWVDPNHRGRGIGTELVRRVLQRHVNTIGPLEQVYLLTLSTTSDWYEVNFGFEIVPDPYIPESMSLEVQAGKLITSLIGAKLVCMQGRSTIITEQK